MKVVLLGVDEWEALYIDGKKVEENHSLNLNYTLEMISKALNEGQPNHVRTFEYEHYYFEPETTEEREEWEMGIHYADKLEEVDPILRGDISL